MKRARIKDAKASARGKYNRRLNRVAFVLDDLEDAEKHLKKEKGTIYKAKELEAVLHAIAAFRKSTKLKPYKPPRLPGPMRSLEEIFASIEENDALGRLGLREPKVKKKAAKRKKR